MQLKKSLNVLFIRSNEKTLIQSREMYYSMLKLKLFPLAVVDIDHDCVDRRSWFSWAH